MITAYFQWDLLQLAFVRPERIFKYQEVSQSAMTL